jgi:hypothetical protein
VAAYRAVLEERTRERVPLQWAASTGNERCAMMVIADRDAVLAESAVRKIETAYEVTLSGGQEQWSTYYHLQLRKAQAVRNRLKGQSGEYNSVNG